MSSFDFNSLSDADAQQILNDNAIALKVDEARQVQSILKRPPTLSECILWGIQGSEHCSYKSSRIHLKTLTVDGSDVILGAKEDAGIVSVATDNNGNRYGVIMSHESHNHPSQIVPFEGAATGIGGNVRDVCCMGGTVIANADMLRFGTLDQHKTHWITEGVVEGIASYSNALGVPNMTGDVYFNSAYNDNCLVTVVTLGVIKESDIVHSYAPENSAGHDLILVGKPTDNSGFGGASFASIDLEEEKEEQNRGAVQEPNAFLGRHMLKSNYAMFEKLKKRNLLVKVGFKDLGAGGVACASVELAEAGGFGSDVVLDHVHTAMDGLHPTVILCAETQERYMWVSPPELTDEILKHYNEEFALPDVSEGARASVVGKVRADDRYTVTYQGDVLIDARSEDITSGIVYDRPTEKPERDLTPVSLKAFDAKQTWLDLLAHPSIASQKPIFEKYDKQVQGRTYLEREQTEAGVFKPYNDSSFPEEIRDVAISLGVADNPAYGQIDAYHASIYAVCEAMAKCAASGTAPVAITDCLCFGNPEKPTQMHDFVMSIKGLKAACETVTLLDKDEPTPIIAGNVSLYNESKSGAIPPSPLISCLGKTAHFEQTRPNIFQQSGSLLVQIGQFNASVNGSILAQLQGQLGDKLPALDLVKFKKIMCIVAKSKLLSAKVIGLGGIATSLAKMAASSSFGFDVQCDIEPFAEGLGFIAEVDPAELPALTAACAEQHVPLEVIGRVVDSAQYQFNDVQLDKAQADEAWHLGLRSKLG